MELSLSEIVACNKALEVLSKKHYKNFAIALKLAHLKKKLAEESDFYMQQERDIIDRYAEKQEDGNFKLTNGNLTFKTAEDVKGFSEDLDKLKNTPVDIGEPIKIDINTDIAADQESLTPDEILAIGNVVEFSIGK